MFLFCFFRPVLCLKNKDLLYEWFQKLLQGKDEQPPPESEIFKSENYSNFIYLFFKIGTEVNVFSHLGKVLFMHMKEAMFADQKDDSDTDDEKVEEPPGPGGPVDAVDDKPQENWDGENSHDIPTDNSIDAQDKSLDKQKDSLPDESQDGCSSNDSAENKKSSLHAHLEECLDCARVVKQATSTSPSEPPGEIEDLQKCKITLAEIRQILPELFCRQEAERPKTVTSMYGKVYSLKDSWE